jgi:5,10-methenyltetrahydrofolate synthetase
MDGFGKKHDDSSSFDLQTKKRNLRNHFKSVLSRIPGDDRRLYEFELKKNLEAFFFEKSSTPGVWASYMPTATEANPHIQLPFVTWAYPKTFGEEMRFFTSTQGAVFEPNHWGIDEPVLSSSNEVPKNDLLGILVPGLAFSKTGKRLGRGKAYYDKYLKDFKGVKVGLAFDLQVEEDIPFEEHDVTMDYLVTNKDTITCEVNNG